MNKVIDTYYRENFNLLVKRCGGRLGSVQDGEDAVQETFLRAIKYFESYDSRVKFAKWFEGILANVVRDSQREIRMAGLTKNIDEAIDELEPTIPDHVKDHFRNHMDLLSKHKASYDKEVVRLHILFGYTSKEISQLLGLANGTVRNSISCFCKEVQEIYK